MEQRQIKMLAFVLILIFSGFWGFVYRSQPEQLQASTKANDEIVPNDPKASAIREIVQQKPSDEGWHLPANAKDARNPVKPTLESVAKGKELYKANCLMCHGETGEGNGPLAATLQPKPSNLTDKKKMAQYTDGELFWMISKGKLPMPAFEKNLSKENRWHIVNYIRTLVK